MRTVLIVSYRYPPQLYIGSLRVGKFVKYLPEFGWKPIVLTVNPEKDNIFFLPDEIKIGKVIRTKDFDLKHKLKVTKFNLNKLSFIVERRINIKMLKLYAVKFLLRAVNDFLCFPDPKIGWYWIVKKNAKILKSYNIDILFTSSPPPTVHLIGNYLKKKLDVPWLADFRDLWTQNHISRRIYPLWKIEQKLEKQVLRSCDTMITVSKPLAEQLENFHEKPVAVLTNGFDEDDYKYKPMKNVDKKFRIVYTGNIYRHKRDPSLLFQAVKALLNEGFLHKGEIKIDFYGRETSWARQICYKMNMEEIVCFHGMVSYKESVHKQMEADLLLLLEWVDKKAEGVYTGKIFEYLGAKRPILAIGPKGGVIDELLKETGAGILVSNIDEIKKILKTWITTFRQEGILPYGANYEAIRSKYSRRTKAKELACIFDNLIKSKKMKNISSN